MPVPPSGIPANAIPNAIPRRARNQLVITSAVGIIVEAVMPMPSRMKITKNAAAELARQSATYATATIAAPAIITLRAPIRSINDPMNGLQSPAASGAVATRAENSARLHPKCFTTDRKNTPLAFIGPHIRNSVTKRTPTISHEPLSCAAMIHLAREMPLTGGDLARSNLLREQQLVAIGFLCTSPVQV